MRQRKADITTASEVWFRRLLWLVAGHAVVVSIVALAELIVHLFGLILFATAEWLILPAADSALLGIPVLHWGIAHAIYGIVPGLLSKQPR